MNIYGDVFAKRFARSQGQWLYRTIGPNIQKFYENTPVGSTNRNMLDLACGAGVLTRYFAEKNYRVTGLDLSIAMIEMAKQSNKNFIRKRLVELKCQDITRFNLASPVGLAVGIGQIPNHLPDLDAFQQCCAHVHQTLVAGGYFIADILLDTASARQLKKSKIPLIKKSSAKTGACTNINIIDNDNELSIDLSLYDPASKKSVLHSIGLVHSAGKYERFQETLYLTHFQMTTVTDMVKSTGFRQVYFAELEDLATSKSVEKIHGFKFMIAQK